MSKTVGTVLLALLVAALAPSAAHAGGNVSFTLGERDLSDDWSPLDGQPTFGVVVDWGMDDWPVHLAWGLNVSADSEDIDIFGANEDFIAAYAEISFGAVWLPIQDKSFRPYLGAGIASVSAAYESEAYGLSSDEYDQDFGYYANAGIYWRLGSSFNLGLDLRYGGGTELEFDRTDGSKFDDARRFDGQYFAYSLLLGWGWGK